MAIINKEKEEAKPAPTPLIKDYAAAFRRHIVVIAILAGILTALLCALVLMLSHTLTHDMVSFWVVSLLVGVTAATTSMLAASLVYKPLRNLLRTVAHVAGEPLAGTIPNPNDKEYAKNGLGAAIQTIYALDNAAQKTAPKKTTKSAIATASLNRMHGAIMTLDASRAIVYASGSAPTQTIDGVLHPQLLFHEGDTLDAWLDECTETAVKAEKAWQRIPDRPADAEEQRIFDVYASYEKGSPYETVITAVDMTDRYLEDEEDLNFIAFAAHELRGPITVIRGYIDVLESELDGIIQPEQHELFNRLSVSANRLSSYVNNILNTSRYDRRHLSLTLVPDTVAAVYATISDDMALRASSQHRLLSVQIPQDLPQIAADRASLSEVISNLIDNAIKYSHEGGIITVSAAQQGDFVNISVQDQGIGMASDIMKNLFQKFYRSHRSREVVAGSGIGLYISKAIVESHGGTISVNSAEGKGSTFTVSIPTYASVADQLAGTGSNQNLISEGKGWIKNHSMYRG